MRPLQNFFLFLILLACFGSCTAISARQGDREHSAQTYVEMQAIKDGVWSDPLFYVCLIAAFSATILFITLLNTSPVFRNIATWVAVIYTGCVVANFIKRWWHNP